MNVIYGEGYLGDLECTFHACLCSSFQRLPWWPTSLRDWLLHGRTYSKVTQAPVPQLGHLENGSMFHLGSIHNGSGEELPACPADLGLSPLV